MEPIEKKKSDFDYVDLFFSVSLGVILGVVLEMGNRDEVPMASPGFTIFTSSLVSYLICRWINPPKLFLGSCFGLAAMGFWQIWMGYPHGPDSVVVALGLAIGSMLARHVAARKASSK